MYDIVSILNRLVYLDVLLSMPWNPNSKKIAELLLAGQTTPDWLRIWVRDSELKLEALLHIVTIGELLGNTAAWIKDIHFQKRGLPHAHYMFSPTYRQVCKSF